VVDDFDIDNFLGDESHSDQYQRQLRRLRDEDNSTECIEQAVQGALANLADGQQKKSFVIYGEPQSGKTEMMICLTAKLLDDGYSFLVHLLNDSVDLLGQNIGRFHTSGLAPSAQNFQEIQDPSVNIKAGRYIVFSKKNGNDLRHLLNKIEGLSNVIVIDDEADYASPNPKVNKGEKTPINSLIERVIGKTGHYIGVTATPARLNLNNTFNNDSRLWVKFPPHRMYTGQNDFFPINLVEGGAADLKYRLTLLSDKDDNPKNERAALFSFFVNVAHLNITTGDEINYSFLVHTSGKKDDHRVDLKTITAVFGVLSDQSHPKFAKYVREVWEISKGRYSDISANNITRYVIKNISRRAVLVLNSEPDFKKFGGNATNPSALFTIVIGGNIVSRGVTFKNLLSMYFTRDVKTKMQQDTYIQRARMFGNRGAYLRHFELTIPAALYVDWHRCFVYHRLALASIENGLGSPVWIGDKRIQAVATASIDRSTVDLDRGEMSFAIFDFEPKIDGLVEIAGTAADKIAALGDSLGDAAFPGYLREFILRSVSSGRKGIRVFPTADVFPGMTEDEKREIARRQGFLTLRDADRAGGAVHFLRIIKNAQGKARLFYKYDGSVEFLRNFK
jgi:hypothetical protein